MLASTVSSSLVQPLFGLWSDRRGAIWLLPLGVGLAGLGIALAADAPSYWSCLALVVLSGSALPPTLRGDRSSRRTPAGGRARAGCRRSRSAATSASRPGRSSRLRSSLP